VYVQGKLVSGSWEGEVKEEPLSEEDFRALERERQKKETHNISEYSFFKSFYKMCLQKHTYKDEHLVCVKIFKKNKQIFIIIVSSCKFCQGF
jgi:hypothetical protein